MNPVFVAIDTPELHRALELCGALRARAGGFKLGLEFFAANGPGGVRRIGELGVPVFLDLKLHDIPNTVGKAAAALRPLRPAVLTVHASGGPAMMAAAKAESDAATRVVAVTVLTSLDAQDLKATGVDSSPAEQVERLAVLARESGLDGIVCSGTEVAAARAGWGDGYFVVPGVRPEGSGAGDQKRVVTPRQALDRGASMLVIGRPVTAAQDPEAALAAILESL